MNERSRMAKGQRIVHDCFDEECRGDYITQTNRRQEKMRRKNEIMETKMQRTIESTSESEECNKKHEISS